MMKTLYLIGAVLTLAACAQQQPPPPPVAAAPPPPPPVAMAPPPPPPMLASLDGVYAGSLTIASSGLSDQDLNRTGCVSGRPARALVRNGLINLEYANWKRHKLHYKGRVDANGTVTAYHKNSDGSSSVLNGQIANGQLTGDMQRGPCNYSVALAMR
jgi:hypothetical protein